MVSVLGDGKPSRPGLSEKENLTGVHSCRPSRFQKLQTMPRRPGRSLTARSLPPPGWLHPQAGRAWWQEGCLQLRAHSTSAPAEVKGTFLSQLSQHLIGLDWLGLSSLSHAGHRQWWAQLFRPRAGRVREAWFLLRSIRALLPQEGRQVLGAKTSALNMCSKDRQYNGLDWPMRRSGRQRLPNRDNWLNENTRSSL